MPHKDVRNLVLSVDDEKLTEQILQQLTKYMPGKEEVLNTYVAMMLVHFCLQLHSVSILLLSKLETHTVIV